MTTMYSFTFFGNITNRDHFDLMKYTLQTAVRLTGDATDFLLDAATSGKLTSITGGNQESFRTLAEACEEVGLSYHTTELDEANIALRRECWQPGASRSFCVELTRNGEPAYTSEQIRDAIQAAGSSRMIDTLQRWAHADIPTRFQIDQAVIDEIGQERSPRI